VHNVIYSLVELEKPLSALRMLRSAAQLYRSVATPRGKTLARWLEARAVCAAGHPEEAAQLLSEVSSQLADLGAGYDLAMAQLHLALAYRQSHRLKELRATCRKVAVLASSLGIEDARLGALRLQSDALPDAEDIKRMIAVLRSTSPRRLVTTST
jgi:hypothetical protein